MAEEGGLTLDKIVLIGDWQLQRLIEACISMIRSGRVETLKAWLVKTRRKRAAPGVSVA